jgi:RNA polymerase sigma-70 factor (ECF subfamily)
MQTLDAPSGEEMPHASREAPPERSTDARLDVMQVLQELTPEHRQIIVLREMEQMSYEEIADVLSIPRGTVESRLHRARAELKERLGKYLEK